VSDINDRYPHDDADVIEIKQAMDNTSIPLVPIVMRGELDKLPPHRGSATRYAANIMRVADDDVDRDGGVVSAIAIADFARVAATNVAAPLSTGTRDLAAMDGCIFTSSQLKRVPVGGRVHRVAHARLGCIAFNSIFRAANVQSK
jgi:hypothetical protein